MKILICTHQYNVGGISKVVNSLRNVFNDLGHTVNILSPKSPLQKAGDLSIRCLDVPGLIGSLSFWLKANECIVNILDSYDIIMIHHPLFLSKNLLFSNKNIIITFHGTYFGYSQAYNNYNLGKLGPYYYFMTKIEKNLLKKISKINNNRIFMTGVSPNTIFELESNGFTGVSHFIPNAISHPINIVSKNNARKLLNECYGTSLKLDDEILLCVGSVKNVQSKRPLLVASIFDKLKNIDKLKLIMIGGGYTSNNLKQMSKKNWKIIYFEFIPADKLYLFYSAADAYISLSCYEGMPNSVLEAATFNLPLILSDISAHKWVIQSGIGHGILVNTLNPELEVKDGLTSIKSQNSSDNSAQNNLDRFSWENIAQEYIEISKKKDEIINEKI